MYSLTLLIFSLVHLVSAHIALWHPSMYGFNVTDKTFAPRDNRPVVPLQDLTFNEWWFHGHLAYPPHPGDVFKLPVGGTATAELACHKGATSYWQSSEGGDVRQGQSPCPNAPTSAFHTTGFGDVKGCALAITYKSDVQTIAPEDFTIFSVNHTCVWTRFTDFQVPSDLPPCPAGGCTCAWFWIHSEDSGSEQNYMNGFKCEVTGSKTGGKPLQKPKVARRCGADPKRGRPTATPSNCTVGAKQPLYWHQKERNNMFEGEYSPPFYNDLYGFRDGAQNDIFEPQAAQPPPPPSPQSKAAAVTHSSSTVIATVKPRPTNPGSQPTLAAHHSTNPFAPAAKFPPQIPQPSPVPGASSTKGKCRMRPKSRRDTGFHDAILKHRRRHPMHNMS